MFTLKETPSISRAPLMQMIPANLATTAPMAFTSEGAIRHLLKANTTQRLFSITKILI